MESNVTTIDKRSIHHFLGRTINEDPLATFSRSDQITKNCAQPVQLLIEKLYWLVAPEVESKTLDWWIHS